MNHAPEEREELPPQQKSDSDLPTWLQAVLRLGVVSAIAMWFVYRVTTVFEERLNKVEDHMMQTRTMVSQVKDELSDHDRQTYEWLTLARQICVNTSQTEDQRSRCLQNR